ncbi:hypothetical protein J601_3453 [Acinetobacter baumannii 831240]|nr:hypothetical protein ACINWC348_2049 [Acinetobacter baumannii WC-348]ETQ77326.1 hypothetical protein P668_0165 [Acinetobacter baumannii UH5207]EXF14750.1 hypothetical protein J601_3759 [Acinetobacter baumannii 831240]EXF16330.1 hypothetical protein J601_3453 [Acinetobacter baumannii 831240]
MININHFQSVVCADCGVKFKPASRYLELGAHKPHCTQMGAEMVKKPTQTKA